MKYLIVVLLVASGIMWGFVFGKMDVSVEDKRLAGMSEIKCNDIIRYTKDSASKAGELVCEINMQAEDDNIKIYKGTYAAN